MDMPKIIRYELINTSKSSTLFMVFDPKDEMVKSGECVVKSGVESCRAKSGNYCNDKTISSMRKHGYKMAKSNNVPFTEIIK